MKFAHISDSHLGGWRQPELQKLNLDSFKVAIETCINESVDFILFTGDLFDSAFPPIDILKATFEQFKNLKEAGIKCFLIPGSHDYSVSGKTFLDVLEKAGFCEISKYHIETISGEEKIVLEPFFCKSAMIYGYPGKKSGLEIEDLRKIHIKESYESKFRILMLHTTIDDVKGTLPIDSISLEDLPKADYYALGHIHINFEEEFQNSPVIYSGPTFPNNFKEFEELSHGSFYIINVEGYTKIIKKEIKLKDVEKIEVELDNSLIGTQKILDNLKKKNLSDKIVLLKIKGNLVKGKPSDIKFLEIQKYLNEVGIYSFLRNTSQLDLEKQEFNVQLKSNEMGKVEEVLIKKYKHENPSNFNDKIFSLMEALSLEKQEGEKREVFSSRLFSEINKIFNISLD